MIDYASVAMRTGGRNLRPDQRVVTRLPLAELWDDSGPLEGKRFGRLDKTEVSELLRNHPVQFVVADCGEKLRWVPKSECFEFWKAIKVQIAEPATPIYLQKFPNETAYSASEWRGPANKYWILLEKHH